MPYCYLIEEECSFVSGVCAACPAFLDSLEAATEEEDLMMDQVFSPGF